MIGLALYVWLLVGRRAADRVVLPPRRALGLALGACLPRALRARALLQRLPRGPAHLGGARRRRRLPGLAATRPAERRGAVAPAAAAAVSGGARSRAPGRWALLGVLLALVGDQPARAGLGPVAVPPGGGGPAGPARAARARRRRGVGRRHRPRGRACSRRCCAARPALLLWRAARVAGRAAVALVLVVGLMLLAPSTLLQSGLRDSTEPWFFTNDSTYQIELAGELLLDGDNPYGHDYRGPGWSASTRATAASRSGCATRGGARPLRLLPRHGGHRGRVAAAARARSTTTGCSSCSARWPRSSPRSPSARRWPGGWRWAR